MTGSSVSGTPVTANAAQRTWGGSSASGFTLGDAWLGILSPDLRSLIAATHLGGRGSERPCYGLAEGEDGDIYCSGHTESDNFPTTAGAFSRQAGGGSDGFVSRFTSDLSQLLSSTYVGGPAGDTFRGALNFKPSTRQLFACGAITSNGFGRAGAIQQSSAGGRNEALMVVLNQDLSAIQHGTYLGSSSASPTEVMVTCTPVDTDSVIVSFTTPTNSFANGLRTSGARAGTDNDRVDHLVARIDGVSDTMRFAWVTVVGPNGGQTPSGGIYHQAESGMAIDPAGDIYVLGETNGGGIGTGLNNHSGGTDCYVAKIDGNGGGTEWLRFVGGSADDNCTGIITAGDQDVIFAGKTRSTNLPVTSNAMQSRNGGGADAFIASVGADGTLNYLSYFGGSGDEDARWSCRRSDGRVAIVGQSSSPTVPGATNTFQPSNGGGISDMLVSVWDNIPLEPPGASTPFSTIRVDYEGGCPDHTASGSVDCSGAGSPGLTGQGAARYGAGKGSLIRNGTPLQEIGNDLWASFSLRLDSFPQAQNFTIPLIFSRAAGSVSESDVVGFQVLANGAGGTLDVECQNNGPADSLGSIAEGTTYTVVAHWDRGSGQVRAWLNPGSGALAGAAGVNLSCGSFDPPLTYYGQAFNRAQGSARADDLIISRQASDHPGG